MSAVLSKALDVANDNLLSAQLAHIEKTEGRKLPCYQMALTAKAKPLADVLGEETFDAATAAPRREAFEAITDETLDFVKPRKDAQPVEWSSFESSAEDFRRAFNGRCRRVRDNVPYSTGERPVEEFVGQSNAQLLLF